MGAAPGVSLGGSQSSFTARRSEFFGAVGSTSSKQPTKTGAVPGVRAGAAGEAQGGPDSMPESYIPSKSELSTHTWVYHAMMDAVNRLQDEHAVAISVFI